MIEKEKTHSLLDRSEKLELLARWLTEKQASKLVALDVEGLCPITETLLVVTARGVRHAQGLADMLLDRSSEDNIEYLGMEGYKGGAWILMDFNDVVVHIFQEEHRALYNLEGLWAEAKVMPLPEDGEDQ
ncbi:ribosome-associated protein [Paucidesulfovibrio gracilis DSM 16080]|uniref:Ribosomal silencing factor RsfS n=1 Tax=Paucidesulfovibrio gracilis DSM 16080 TaxID=1121449 RepID=A0A1T4WTA6_9BACT|nr:ribosome silencing factor [Paucidesulfovibrio gracilis]SKA80347.1 ribosome-associated protein [Paucidesulfovibrio gracilis DSM 16080]